MCHSPRDNLRKRLLGQLRQQLGRAAITASAQEANAFSSGVPAIDRLVAGDLRYGTLMEWLAESPGSGAVTLSLLTAREACRAGGMLVVVDRRRALYPPAAVAWGIDLGRLIVVHPRTRRDEVWATIQSLGSPVVAAVWAAVDRLEGRAFRRLQLAAEAGRSLGLLVRPASARRQPSWADVRLEVGAGDWGLGTRGWKTSPQPLVPSPFRTVQVQALRCRHGRAGSSVLVEIDDAAHVVREVKEKALGYRPNLLADSR